MRKSSSLELKKPSLITNVLKGVFVSLFITVVGILLFAFVLRFIELNSITIKIINQIIKILSVLFGVKICLKVNNNKGLLKGFFVGFLYTILSYSIFAIVISNFSFGVSLFYDSFFAGLVGIICGVLFVNAKK